MSMLYETKLEVPWNVMFAMIIIKYPINISFLKNVLPMVIHWECISICTIHLILKILRHYCQENKHWQTMVKLWWTPFSSNSELFFVLITRPSPPSRWNGCERKRQHMLQVYTYLAGQDKQTHHQIYYAD